MQITLERFNQIHLSICDLCHAKEYQKRKKCTEAFLRFTSPPPPTPKLTDIQTNRQLGSRKVLGTAELKNYNKTTKAFHVKCLNKMTSDTFVSGFIKFQILNISWYTVRPRACIINKVGHNVVMFLNWSAEYACSLKPHQYRY